MSSTPQLHLYGHMPENMRKVEVPDASEFTSSVEISSKQVVEAKTNKPLWRWTLALFLDPVHATAAIQNADKRALSIRNAEKRSEGRRNRSSGPARDMSAGTVLNRSPNILLRDRKDQISLTQIKGVGRSHR